MGMYRAFLSWSSCLGWCGLLLWLTAPWANAADPTLRVTPSDLFALLDPAVPGMAEIRRLGSGANAEPEAATKAFAAYLRQRKQKRFSDRLEFNPKVAENALAGRIGKHTFPEGKIDWSLDTAELTRTSVWSDFAGGYEKGQAGYAQAFAKQFRAKHSSPNHTSRSVLSIIIDSMDKSKLVWPHYSFRKP